jgi:hypothetical protein
METPAFLSEKEAEIYAEELQWSSEFMVDHAFDPCTLEQKEERAKICRACEKLTNTLDCSEYHYLFMPQTIWESRKACPLGKWNSLSDAPDYDFDPAPGVDEYEIDPERITVDYCDYLLARGMEFIDDGQQSVRELKAYLEAEGNL